MRVKTKDVRIGMRVRTAQGWEGEGTIVDIYDGEFSVRWDDGEYATYFDAEGFELYFVNQVESINGVCVDILKKDAEYIGIKGLDNLNPFSLGVQCERAAMSRTNDPSVIRQVFVWGMMYLTQTMNNPKAPILMEKSFKKSNQEQYYDVASEFMEYVDLIK